MSEITTYQPVLISQISSIDLYKPAFIDNKYGLKNYVVKNDRMFEIKEGKG